jgi:hypothetical protein
LERAQESALARLPSVEELRRSAKDGLEQLWDELGSTKKASAFFAEVDKILQTKVDVFCRVRIARAMAAYCRTMALECETATSAERTKQLAKLVRSNIVRLQKLTEGYERKLGNAKDARRTDVLSQAGQECWAIYQDAERQYEELRDLTFYPSGRRLAAAATIVWKALNEAAVFIQ